MFPRRPMYVAVLALAATACTGENGDPTRVASYVMPVGTIGVLGVLTYSDGSSLGYLCGQNEHIDETSWLSGQDGALQGDGWSATLGAEDLEVVGPDGSWRSDLASIAGGEIYEATPDGCRTGLLLFSENGEWQSTGAFCNTQGSFFQVEPVGTIVSPTLTLPVRVLTDDETLEFEVTRLP